MQSMAFIEQANKLTARIVNMSSYDETYRQQLQKEINQLFSSLQNPTLPSAYRLRDAALRAGFQVSQSVLNRLALHENL